MAEPVRKAPPRPRPWWCEMEVLLLVVLVGGIYFSRLTTLTLRGEETRRAEVAAEILRTGDWIVPRQQGTIYLSRPPLGSWPIAALTRLRGDLDVVAIRLPTVIAVLLTTLLVYGYARSFLSRLGALAAAVAYPTMGQVLQIGRVAETEGLFTLLVAASLLVWHGCHVRRVSPVVTWSLGYALAALAGLVKGPQGPIYFVAVTWTFLLFRRDWKTLLGWSHLAGLSVFAVVLGAWQVPYLLRTDWASTKGIWTQQAAQRFTDYRPWPIVRHLLGYPLEVLACMLPWSIFLVQLFNGRFWRKVGTAKPHVLFLLTCLAMTFPSVWLAPGARGRYYMPLYPIVAVLVGLVVDRCWPDADGTSTRLGWQRFVLGMATVAVVGTTVVLIAGGIDLPMAAQIAQPLWFAVLLFGCGLALAVWGFATHGSRQFRTAQVTVLAIGCFLGLVYTGAVVNAKARVMQDIAGPVARLKTKLPKDAHLVSLGIVNHNFRYHFRDAIPMVPWPGKKSSLDRNVDYFCFDGPADRGAELPWNWEQVAVIPIRRNRDPKPARTVVVVGRRVESQVRATRRNR